MQEVKSQADKRRSIVARDQFGRPWGGSIEIESGDFTGLVSSAGWEDPMRTPQKYIKTHKNQWGHPEMGRVTLDLDAWIKDQQVAMQDWVRNFWKVGKELYAGRFDPKEHQDDPYLLEQCGPKPYPSVECIEVLLNENHQAHMALLGDAPMNDAAIKMLGHDPDAKRAVKEAAMTIQEKEKERSAKMALTIVQFLALDPTPTYHELVTWGSENGYQGKEGFRRLGMKWKAFKELRKIDEVEEIEEHEPEMETA